MSTSREAVYYTKLWDGGHSMKCFRKKKTFQAFEKTCENFFQQPFRYQMESTITIWSMQIYKYAKCTENSLSNCNISRKCQNCTEN